MFIVPHSEGTSYPKYTVAHANNSNSFRIPQSGMNWLISVCNTEVI